jgi:hypothetical protein
MPLLTQTLHGHAMRRASKTTAAKAAASKHEADQRKAPGGCGRLFTIMQRFGGPGNPNLNVVNNGEELRKKIARYRLRLLNNHAGNTVAETGRHSLCLE